MRIFRSMLEAGRVFPAAVVAIGKFDGLHRGHRRVLGVAVRKARALKTSLLVVTFDPTAEQHMRLFSYQPVLPVAKRLERLETFGVDGVVLLPFDGKLACTAPVAFARDFLALQLKPLAVCVGEDFCFGKDRAGKMETLQQLGPKLGFLVYPVKILKADGEKISAARIRRLIELGRRTEAEALLGWKLA